MNRQDNSRLGSDAVRGLAWTGSAQVVRQALSFLTHLILARLLLPDDFGLVALAMVFIGVSQLVADFGIGAAIVQRRTTAPDILTAALLSNLAIAAALYCLLWIAAPWLGGASSESNLVEVVRALGAGLIISATTAVPRALLYQRMRFDAVARAEVGGALCGAAAAVGLAVGGAGVWSLVAQPLVGNGVTLTITWRATGWRPRRSLDWGGVGGLVGFSAGVLGSRLLTYARRNTDNLLIGSFLGTAALGYYALAYQLMLYPLTQVSNVVSKVMFPALSKLQDDPPRFCRAYLGSVSAIAAVTFPIMLGLLAVSHDFVLVVFGERWLPMEPVLRMLCLVGLVQSVGTTTGNIYMSTGNTRLMFFVTLATTPLVIASFVIGLRWGIVGVAAGYAVVVFLLFNINFYIALRVVGLSLRDLYARLAPPLLAATLMYLTVFLYMEFMITLDQPAWQRLATGILTGIVSYLFFSFWINREQIREFTMRSRDLLRSRQQKGSRHA